MQTGLWSLRILCQLRTRHYGCGDGNTCSVAGQRGGGLPNALRALAMIFLPIIRLPTPPMTAPMPTGSSLPNASAPRRSA